MSWCKIAWRRERKDGGVRSRERGERDNGLLEKKKKSWSGRMLAALRSKQTLCSLSVLSVLMSIHVDGFPTLEMEI